MSKTNTTTMSSKSEGLVLSGYQKKLKTMKKKYFVLYKETNNGVARLEYYDNEKKFKQGLDPKRVIKLKHCFNINKRLDTKYSYVLSLSTKDGGFGIVLENENDLREWMEVLMSLQRNTANVSDSIYPLYDHVWQVMIQKKGIAEDKGIVGFYHVCLNPKSLTLISIGPEKTPTGEIRVSNVEFLLTTIRRCGDSQCLFYMEVGRQSVIGPGELWMETDDTRIAKNMHDMILSAMSTKSESNMNAMNASQARLETTSEPMRKRSSSANEASKPMNMLQKRQFPIETKNSNSPQSNLLSYGRDRCDSLPTRNRSSSESCNQNHMTSVHSFRSNTISGLRPYSYQRHSNSPPMNTPVGCSESEESSISIDEPDDAGFIPYRFNSRSSEGVIPEENSDEINIGDPKCNDYKSDSDEFQDNYMSMAPVKHEISKFSQFRLTPSMDDTKTISVLSKLNRGKVGLSCEFPEHISDKLSMQSESEDQMIGRPTRTYSIGSKVEHSKINKRIGSIYESEHNSTRVRAFSVGSRAKIPRCDLQRGVLFSKTRNEQNFNNSNNNILISNELPIGDNVNHYCTRDKKSTSAPILTHKSQNSIDRMSDLMEIDFSKISSNSINNRNHSSSSKLLYHQLNNSNHNSNHTATINTANNTSSKKSDGLANISNYDTSEKEISGTNINPIAAPIVPTKPILAAGSSGDSGYLEMKPVGNTLSKNTVNNYSKSPKESYLETVLKPKKSDIANEQLCPQVQSTTVLVNRSDNICFPIPEDKHASDQHQHHNIFSSQNNQQQSDKLSNREVIVSEKLKDVNIKPPEPPKLNQQRSNIIYSKSEINNDNIKTRNLVDNFRNLNMSGSGSQTNPNDDNKIRDNKQSGKQTTIQLIDQVSPLRGSQLKNNGAVVLYEEKKLAQSAGDVFVPKTNKSDSIACSRNETGYKILQIKSDSSLQSSKKLHRSSLNSKQQQHQQKQNKQLNLKDGITLPIGSITSSSSSASSSSSSSSTTIGKHGGGLPHSEITSNLSNPSNSKTNDSNTSPTIKAAPPLLDSLSRPPSVTSEQELYYASLDLPQCSTQNTVKTPKKETFFDSSPVAFNSQVSSNSYAKIDFEHSDSSSSSSKLFNV